MDYREAIEEQQALDRELIAAEEAAIRSELASAWEAELEAEFEEQQEELTQRERRILDAYDERGYDDDMIIMYFDYGDTLVAYRHRSDKAWRIGTAMEAEAYAGKMMEV